jgi:hypothetical protein
MRSPFRSRRRTVPLPRTSTSRTSPGTVSDAGKDFPVHDEDGQRLHGFEIAADAKAYLPSELFTRDC